MRLHLAAALAGLILSSAANANICGSDYQIFNPTTNGLDFVTVQSSETLKPCILNTGLFFNYAANSLTYSQTLNSQYPKGQKRKDRTLGADLSAGFGITDRWDAGINIPFVLNQSVSDNYYVTSFGHNGATEIKANTKYKLLGDDSRGVAAIFSVNQNLVQDNPFTGKNPGLTLNYELAADTTLGQKWAIGANIGFRDRNPGRPIAGVPFDPMGDQYTYSVAASYLFAKLDTKMIMEVYGSKAAKHVDSDADRSLNSLEGLLGFKHDVSRSMALHFGGSHAIDSSLGGADWRVYAGVNWAIGPVCGKPPEVETVVDEPLPAPAQPVVNIFRLHFGWDKDQLTKDDLMAFDEKFKTILTGEFISLSVEGYTDSVGNPYYNIDLSQRRAKFVRDFLVETYALPGDKVDSKGWGAENPIGDNGNYQGRRMNRRVELKITRKP